MIRYVIRRLVQSVPIFFGITLFSYVLMAASGNPVAQLTFRPGVTVEERERLEKQLGINDPFYIQYLRWLTGDDWMRQDTDGDNTADQCIVLACDADGDGQNERAGNRRGILRGDFGVSFTRSRPVSDIFWERVPATLELGLASLVLGTVVGITVGILAAVTKGRWFDNLTRIFAVALTALPIFWFAIMLLLLFAVQLRWFPIGDRCRLSLDDSCPPLLERWNYMVLPVIVLSVGIIAGFSRLMRASMLDIIHQDFIRTANAKGLNERVVWFKHAARNALIPIATALGPSITALLGGAVVTERIFNYPGLGLTSLTALSQRDYPVVMAFTIYAAIANILGYLLSDILYGLIDPRIRLE